MTIATACTGTSYRLSIWQLIMQLVWTLQKAHRDFEGTEEASMYPRLTNSGSEASDFHSSILLSQ
jgi:hypothetical protein